MAAQTAGQIKRESTNAKFGRVWPPLLPPPQHTFQNTVLRFGPIKSAADHSPSIASHRLVLGATGARPASWGISIEISQNFHIFRPKPHSAFPGSFDRRSSSKTTQEAQLNDLAFASIANTTRQHCVRACVDIQVVWAASASSSSLLTDIVSDASSVFEQSTLFLHLSLDCCCRSCCS